jgi:hypothetical protein
MGRGMSGVRAFECGVIGTDWKTIVHHLSAGKAKYSYLLDVRDYWPDVTFKQLTCRVIGSPVQTEKFRHTAERRGVSFRIGDRVKVGTDYGYILDSNDSANFDVLFETGKHAGITLSCHPIWIEAAA